MDRYPSIVRERPLPRYQLIGPLSGNGEATLWQAHDLYADRPVTAKLLPAIVGTEQFVECMRRVGLATAMWLTHPGLVRVVGCELLEAGPTCLVALEPLAGETLADRLRREGPLHPEEAARVILGVAEVLDAARMVGMVHGALTTAGVLLTDRGEVRVLDFGIPDAAWTAARLPAHDALGASAARFAPEQVEGRRPTVLSDVYALGAILYEMLAGTVPAGGGVSGEIRRAWARRISRDGYEHLVVACTLALAARPLFRPGSPAAFAALVRGDSPRARFGGGTVDPVRPVADDGPLVILPDLALLAPVVEALAPGLVPERATIAIKELDQMEPAWDLTGPRSRLPRPHAPPPSPNPVDHSPARSLSSEAEASVTPLRTRRRSRKRNQRPDAPSRPSLNGEHPPTSQATITEPSWTWEDRRGGTAAALPPLTWPSGPTDTPAIGPIRPLRSVDREIPAPSAVPDRRPASSEYRDRYIRALVPAALMAVAIGSVSLMRAPAVPGTETPVAGAVRSAAAPAPSGAPRSFVGLGVGVPDLTGMTATEAADALDSEGHSLARLEPASGDPGTVVGSEPAPGRLVPPGTSVVVFVGAAPESATQAGANYPARPASSRAGA